MIFGCGVKKKCVDRGVVDYLEGVHVPEEVR